MPFELLYNLSMTCLKCGIIAFYFRYDCHLCSYWGHRIFANVHLWIVCLVGMRWSRDTERWSYGLLSFGVSHQSSLSSSSVAPFPTRGTQANLDRAAIGTICISSMGLETCSLILQFWSFRSPRSGSWNCLQHRKLVSRSFSAWEFCK